MNIGYMLATRLRDLINLYREQVSNVTVSELKPVILMKDLYQEPVGMIWIEKCKLTRRREFDQSSQHESQSWCLVADMSAEPI